MLPLGEPARADRFKLASSALLTLGPSAGVPLVSLPILLGLDVLVSCRFFLLGGPAFFDRRSTASL